MVDVSRRRDKCLKYRLVWYISVNFQSIFRLSGKWRPSNFWYSLQICWSHTDHLFLNWELYRLYWLRWLSQTTNASSDSESIESFKDARYTSCEPYPITTLLAHALVFCRDKPWAHTGSQSLTDSFSWGDLRFLVPCSDAWTSQWLPAKYVNFSEQQPWHFGAQSYTLNQQRIETTALGSFWKDCQDRWGRIFRHHARLISPNYKVKLVFMLCHSLHDSGQKLR